MRADGARTAVDLRPARGKGLKFGRESWLGLGLILHITSGSTQGLVTGLTFGPALGSASGRARGLAAVKSALGVAAKLVMALTSRPATDQAAFQCTSLAACPTSKSATYLTTRLAFGLVAGLALGTVGEMAEAKPVVLTAQQMVVFGSQALLNGYAEQALAIAEVLLGRDPKDSEALILKAQALRVMQRWPESEAAARAGWAGATTPPLRYAAATAVAQALSLQEHRTRSQFWLRRAVQYAPNAEAQRQALEDFAYVRSQNPLTLQLDASIRPSDNVNGGAMDPLFNYQGIPFILSGDALALSGLAYGLGMQGRYKLAETQAATTALIFAGSYQGVVLSDAAHVQAPDAQNGDYALGHVEAGFDYKTATAIGTATTGVTGGHSWYGGADLSNSLSFSAALQRALGAGQINWLATATRQMRLDHPISSSSEADLVATYDLNGPSGDQWEAGLTVARIVSDDISINHAEASLALGWQARQPLVGLGLGGSLALRRAEYAASPYTATGRQDLRWAASLTAEVNKMTYLGFAPVLSLDFSRNTSNVALYDTLTAGVSVSIKSRF